MYVSGHTTNVVGAIEIPTLIHSNQLPCKYFGTPNQLVEEYDYHVLLQWDIHSEHVQRDHQGKGVSQAQ